MPDLENENTIEFRLFRGTLRYSTFMATLQLVDEICNAAISLSDREFERMAWSDFVMQIKNKPELIEYLKSKRLYVNEAKVCFQSGKTDVEGWNISKQESDY